MIESAYILHQYPYQNSSLILRVFSRQRGLISVIAKGCKRAKSNIQGLMQAFLPLSLELYGHGELLKLRKAELRYAAPRLTQKPMLAGLYLNELLLKLLPPGDPCPQLFDYYQHTLTQLHAGSLSICLRAFEWQLFEHLGIAPSLTHDNEGHTILSETYYQLTPGSELIKSDLNVKGNDRYPGWLFIAIQEQQWKNQEVLELSKKLFREWITYYNEGAPLRAPNIYRQIFPIYH